MDNRELRKKDKEASSQDMVLASLTITTETDNQIINESVNYPEGFNMNNTYIIFRCISMVSQVECQRLKGNVVKFRNSPHYCDRG